MEGYYSSIISVITQKCTAVDILFRDILVTMKTQNIQKPEVRKALLYCVALTLGTAGLLSSDSNSRTIGVLFALTGAVGLAWWFRGWQQWRSAEQFREAEAKRKAALQSARREREVEERARRQAERATQANAAARLREVRDAERLADVERAEADAKARLVREEQIEAETKRLNAMTDAVFVREVMALFQLRGYEVRQASVAESGELLLRSLAEDRTGIARVVPSSRTATASDSNSLEAWRMESGAQEAFLISRSGFTPELVRLSGKRSVMLIEPHLLATWKQRTVASAGRQ